MFNLTRLEQQAIAFITCSLIIGGGVTLVRSYQQDVPVREETVQQAVKPSSQHIPIPGIASPDSDKTIVDDKPTSAIDINTATAVQLQMLPGIGPKLAERVVSYREQQGRFRTVEDLLEVKGIGPSVLSRIKPLIIVS